MFPRLLTTSDTRYHNYYTYYAPLTRYNTCTSTIRLRYSNGVRWPSEVVARSRISAQAANGQIVAAVEHHPREQHLHLQQRATCHTLPLMRCAQSIHLARSRPTTKATHATAPRSGPTAHEPSPEPRVPSVVPAGRPVVPGSWSGPGVLWPLFWPAVLGSVPYLCGVARPRSAFSVCVCPRCRECNWRWRRELQIELQAGRWALQCKQMADAGWRCGAPAPA